MPDFHPATRLIVWGALVVLVQSARGPLLWGFGLFIGAVAIMFASRRAWVLVRRIRYLLLALLVLFGFFTPGEAVLPALGQAGPSVEGLALALTHAWRLLAVVLLVAILLEFSNEALLVSGIATLARPLIFLGVCSERLAVRLLLVFRYAEASPPGGWRALLVARSHLSDEVLVLQRVAMAWWDWVAVGTVIMLGVWGIFR